MCVCGRGGGGGGGGDGVLLPERGCKDAGVSEGGLPFRLLKLR